MISLGLFFIVVVLSLLLFSKWEQKEGLGIEPRVSSILSNHSTLKPNPTFLNFALFRDKFFPSSPGKTRVYDPIALPFRLAEAVGLCCKAWLLFYIIFSFFRYLII